MIEKSYDMGLLKKLQFFETQNCELHTRSVSKKFFDIDNGLRKITVESSDSIPFYIKELSSKQVESNYTDMLATDIDGYFYKYPKYVGASLITVNGDTPEFEDTNFVYSKNKTGLVTIYVADVIHSSIIVDFFPVFIDSRRLDLKYVYDLDGKTYTPKKAGNSVRVSFSKDITDIVNKAGSIFDTRIEFNETYFTYLVDEFIYSESKKIGNVNALVEYNYLNNPHNLVLNNKETFYVKNDLCVKLANRNIKLDDCKVSLINGFATNIGLTFAINQSTGFVSLEQLVSSNTIGVGDEIEITYSYLSIFKPSGNLGYANIDYNTSHQIFIHPTLIKKPSVADEVHRKDLRFITYSNEFITATNIDDLSFTVTQAGPNYSFDYQDTSSIQIASPNMISEFYISQTDDIDKYLNSINLKSCGAFRIENGIDEEIESIGRVAGIVNTDFDQYKYYSGSIVKVNTDAVVKAGAGIGVVSGNILPIDFFIDNKTDDFISISIDVSGLEDYIGSLVTTDVDVLAFVQGIDFINTDWSYDKEKIKIAFMESNGDIDTVDPELFFNSTTKELFAVVENRADTKIFVSYNGKISSYGINVWKSI